MDINAKLRPDERIALELRGLYEEAGYRNFRMNRFEEYSFYAGNKDFLVGDRVLTFTNLDGRLMALKPDVTMSIIKNSRLPEGECLKLYYNENVYRENRNATTFQEIPQMGLECIGSLTSEDVTEVVLLAGKTLERIDPAFLLALSDMRFVEEVVGSLELREEVYRHLLRLIRRKNRDGIRKVGEKSGLLEKDIDRLCRVTELQGAAEEVLALAKEMADTPVLRECLEELTEVYRALEAAGLGEKIQLDLSMVNDIDYYNGLIFKGYIPGLAVGVLGGGRYDRAMKKLGRRGGGMGFGLYLSEIARMEEETLPAESELLTIALPKGRLGDQVYEKLAMAGYEYGDYEDKNRQLILENPEKGVRYILVKPGDVAVYVEHKAADIGIVGKDILMETEPDVYELLDLDIGKCRMCVAAKEGFEDDPSRTLRVATKFVNVAKDHYREKNRDIEIIKLNGSIELGPILGLSDVIVDIVETGSTLRENRLEVVEEFKPISARLICNKASYKFKNAEIAKVVEALR